LDGTRARLDGKLTAGTSSLTLGGQVPTDFAGPIDLRINGAVDLAMANPFLAAGGRNVRGRVDLALAAVGPPSAPRLSGTARVVGGDVQDSSVGTHISDITAMIRADGDVIRLDRVDGRAGPGTVSAGGSIGLTGSRAIDVTLRASNAKILASDLVTALTDANLTVRGAVSGNLVLGGNILVRRADVQVPEKLPPSIAVFRCGTRGDQRRGRRLRRRRPTSRWI